MKNKVYNSFKEALADVYDGTSIMFSWWGLGTGTCNNLILALRDHGAKDLTLICHNTGGVGFGGIKMKPGWERYQDAMPYILLKNKQVKKVIACWGASLDPDNPLNEMIESGEVEVEVVPLGILGERIRAGGAGIQGFYTTVGVGTIYERGKEKRIINGKECILEYPLRADFGLVRAHTADKLGNLKYRLNQGSWVATVATAVNTTIAEVDEIVEVGEIDPERVNTPGLYVDRIVRIPEGGLKGGVT